MLCVRSPLSFSLVAGGRNYGEMLAFAKKKKDLFYLQKRSTSVFYQQHSSCIKKSSKKIQGKEETDKIS